MLGRGSLYSCQRHTRSVSEPCQDCIAEGRGANRSYALLRRQYDELAADNSRLLREIERLRAENERLRALIAHAGVIEGRPDTDVVALCQPPDD